VQLSDNQRKYINHEELEGHEEKNLFSGIKAELLLNCNVTKLKEAIEKI